MYIFLHRSAARLILFLYIVYMFGRLPLLGLNALKYPAYICCKCFNAFHLRFIKKVLLLYLKF